MLKMGRLTEEVKRPKSTLWKYKAINGCYYNSPSACADKCGQYEDIDVDPVRLAKIKKAFDIIKKKKVNVSFLFRYLNGEITLEELNKNRWKQDKLTLDECNILKEALTMEEAK